MKGFVEQLRLAEKAAEDIYFQKVNHELIEALHRRQVLAGAGESRSEVEAATAPKQRPSQERLS